jgi:hypothetical protein
MYLHYLLEILRISSAKKNPGQGEKLRPVLFGEEFLFNASNKS